MLIKNLRDEYNKLVGNETYLKTIKLKKFLIENKFSGNFTDIDIFISQLFQQQFVKKIDYNQFKEILGVLIENNMIECKVQNQNVYSQEQIEEIKNLKKFLQKSKNRKIIEQLYWNTIQLFQNLCLQGKSGSNLQFKEFKYFCQVFQLYPEQINFKKLQTCYQTISQDNQSVNHNQFIEILILIYFQIYGYNTNYKDFGIFLMKLDVSGGWETFGQKTRQYTSGQKFSNKIVQKNKNLTN